MRVSIFSILLCLTFLLFNHTSNAQTGDYNIRKVCMGQGKYAAVVEHHKQFYVIVSNQVIHQNFQVTEVIGSLQIGGQSYIGLYHNNNHQQISVNILSRRQWKYSGFPGARAVCRAAVSPGLRR